MWFPSALSESRIRLLILGTMCTLFGKNIKDRLWIGADNTILSIKEWFIEWTVSNIMVPNVSLIIFFN